MDNSQIRSQFPALGQKINGNQLIYFDNAATSLKPECVIDSISEYYSGINSNVHRASHYLSSQATKAYEQSRQNIASFINAEPPELIFTSGTTDSLNFLASGLANDILVDGDEIILSAMEHHSNIVPWVAIKKYKKIKINVIDIDSNGELIIDDLNKLINKRTKILAISHSSNFLGTLNPVKKIVEIANSHGIITIIDGAQAVAHNSVDVKDIGCDFYCFSGHKMYGPMGIGVLYGRKEILEELSPFRYGGGMIKNVNFDSIELTCLPNRLEAGTPNVSGAIGLSKAVDFLNITGMSLIKAHETDLVNYATNKLIAIEGINIFGNTSEKDPIISFNIDGIHNADLTMLLDNFGIAVRPGQHCTQPLIKKLGIQGAVRMSFSLYNNHEEIDNFHEKLNIAVKMLK
jgi:cysteine desulfurase / selenocysteine lyase